MDGPNRESAESLSFDGLVDLYERTRTFDQQCFDAALDFLVDRFPPQQHATVFEPGVGTGRIALPIAERGYRITGLDISDEMLSSLRLRIAETNCSRISCVLADVAHIPFATGSFDLSIVVHLFYFVAEWQRAVNELFRVLTDTGTLVLMHTGTGAEIPSLNDQYKQRCAQHGYSVETPGVKSTQEVVAYASDRGYQVEQVRDRWTWTTSLQLNTALRYIQARAYSFTAIAPDDVHATVLDELRASVLEEHGSLTTTIDVSNQLYLVLLSRR
jgi:ubiquinone/menaquinone biosynthesis C-methylase UbiE